MLEEKRGQLTLSNLVLLMMVNGSEASEMAQVFKSGQMVPAMKANGRTTELMEKESLFI
jgi:hypothetical protein